jgi:hypothetical protein
MSGSTRDVLRVSVIDPRWPFSKPTQEVARSLCTLLPLRYLHGALPPPDYPDDRR